MILIQCSTVAPMAVIASFLPKPRTSSDPIDQNWVSLAHLQLCPHVFCLPPLTQHGPSFTLRPASQQACLALEFALTLWVTLFPSLPRSLVSAVAEQSLEGFEALLRDPCD